MSHCLLQDPEIFGAVPSKQQQLRQLPFLVLVATLAHCIPAPMKRTTKEHAQQR